MHRRLLPVLDPCHENVAAMPARGAQRHCARCRTAVNDLSAMTRAQARAFLRRHEGQQICVHYRSDPLGEVLFADSGPTWTLAPRSPAQAAGPLATALAGLLTACTSQAEAVEAPSIEPPTWIADAHPTIPDATPPGPVRGEEGFIAGGTVGGFYRVTAGAMVVSAVACRGPDYEYPSSPIRRPPRRAVERPAPRPTRAERRAERRKERRLKRLARRTERAERRMQRWAEAASQGSDDPASPGLTARKAERVAARQVRRAHRLARRMARHTRRVARQLARQARRLAARERRRARKLADASIDRR